MELQRNPRLKLFLVLLMSLNSALSQLAGTDCNGKTYHCVDNQQFQLCEDLPDGKSQTVDDKLYPCPPNLFCDNAGKSECDSPTTSTPSTTASPSSTTASTQSSTTNPPPATTSTTEAPSACTQPGRFPNTTDCHRYYSCTLLPNNTGLRQTNYTCRFGMAFSPTSLRCSTDQSSCYPTFTCQSAGRFADPSDTRSYFWCLKSGSSFMLYHMSCAFGQPFDPVKGRCSGWIGVKQAGVGEQAGRMAFPGRGGYN